MNIIYLTEVKKAVNDGEKVFIVDKASATIELLNTMSFEKIITIFSGYSIEKLDADRYYCFSVKEKENDEF